MKYKDLTINGKDACNTWGVSMDASALSALMTPAGQKDLVEYTNRMIHGKRVINTTPKKADRDITLTFNLVAKDESDFLAKYMSFCEELATGQLNIETKYQSGVVYKCTYISCQQFGEYNRGMAKFTLRLNEPNPDDRA